MEGRIVVTALIFTIIAACSKHSIQEKSFQKTFLAAEKEVLQPSIFFSGWETITGWSAKRNGDATVFSYSRQFPEPNKSFLNEGLVLVFARKLWEEDGELKEFSNVPDKPLMMPFYFLPYFEKPAYTEQWNYTTEANRVNISLIVKGSSEPIPRKKVQVRYMIIPQEVLKRKKQTTETARKLSYEELVKIFGLNS